MEKYPTRQTVMRQVDVGRPHSPGNRAPTTERFQSGRHDIPGIHVAMDHVGVQGPDEAHSSCEEADVAVKATLIQADEANPSLGCVLLMEATWVINRDGDIMPALLKLTRENYCLTLRAPPAEAPK